MKKTYVRWYEKNEYLKAFMALLEGLPTDEQCKIAVDILVETSNMTKREYANILDDIEQYDGKDCKRWYDKNPNLHVAIESLKDLSDQQREIIVQTFSERVLGQYDVNINLDEVDIQ